MAPIRIDTRSDYSLTALRQMSLRRQLRALRVETAHTLGLWRRHPRAMAGRWILAMGRAFVWHPDNNNFRKAIFLALTALVSALLLGDAALGWAVGSTLQLALVGAWLVAFGILTGHEVERIEVAGITLDFHYGRVETDDGGDDR